MTITASCVCIHKKSERLWL